MKAFEYLWKPWRGELYWQPGDVTLFKGPFLGPDLAAESAAALQMDAELTCRAFSLLLLGVGNFFIKTQAEKKLGDYF